MVLDTSNTPSVMPEDLENLIQQGYQLIDVRENDEWDAGHYKSAIHIPMGSIVESIDKFLSILQKRSRIDQDLHRPVSTNVQEVIEIERPV